MRRPGHIHVQRPDGAHLVCDCGARWDARTGAELAASKQLRQPEPVVFGARPRVARQVGRGDD